MKTASKLLSMLLLVAMCLSLMGGSAYALSLEPASGDLALGLPAEGSSAVPEGSSTFDLRLGGSTAVPEGSTTLELEKPGTYTSPDLKWSVGSNMYTTLAKAVEAAKAGDTVTMVQADSVSETVSIDKNITLDLGGLTLSLAKDIVINANVTLRNGGIDFNGNNITVVDGKTLSVYTINCNPNGFAASGTGKVQLYSGTYSAEPKAEYLPSGYEWNSKTGAVGPKGSVYVAYVNGEGYETVNAAFDAAVDLTGNVIIDLIDDTTSFAELTLNGLHEFNMCDSVTINLNNNTLVVGSELLFTKPAVINGYKIKANGVGTYVASMYNSLTLNANVDGCLLAMSGAKVTVNGVEVEELQISDSSTLNMASGTIKKMVIGSGANTINVSGGTVGTSSAPLTCGYTTAVRAVRGGSWYLDETDLVRFDALVAEGYERSGKANPYTVVSKSGSGSGGFTVYGSPYTKGSGNTVYVLMPYTSSTGSYYWSTVSNPTSASQISTISSYYCSVASTGSQYKLTLSNSFLDSLSSGTIYLWTGHDGKYTYMGSLTLNGSGTIVEPGDVAVWPVDSSEWYSGDGMYYFYVTPALQLVEGKNYNYYDVRIDDVLLGGDKFTYNGYQKFGVASSVMDSLSIGTHTITVLTPSGYASCNFRIGATLRPVDTDKHVTGSSKNLQFVCSDSISRVWVGSTELTNLNYGDYWTLSSSGKIITLTAKFMNNQLSAGSTYTLTVQTPNGDRPSCSFQILTTAQAAYSPQTGDTSNLALWATVLVLAGGAAVAILPRLKKHED
ncbi:MAG: hypothetical protein ACI4O0_05955 [Candidatus Limivicinus sp.]